MIRDRNGGAEVPRYTHPDMFRTRATKFDKDRMRFADEPIYAVLGGLRLSGSNEKIIPETIAGLRDIAPSVIASGHCTGWRAVNAFAQAFGEQSIAQLAVGKRLTF